MVKSIDISEKYEPFNGRCFELRIKYRFKYYDHLVADKFGNFFILDHCPGKRTIRFRELPVFNNGKYKTLKYHRKNVSLKSLEKQFQIVDEKLVFYKDIL